MKYIALSIEFGLARLCACGRVDFSVDIRLLGFCSYSRLSTFIGINESEVDYPSSF